MKDVVLLVGPPAAGKSTIAEQYVSKGYVHVNRDTEGGSIAGLVPIVEKALKAGKSVVLDNTFPTVESRAPFVSLAKANGFQVICCLIETSAEDAQFNACSRMIKMYGQVLDLEEIKRAKHPNTFPVSAIFAYRKQFEKPTVAEGFDQVVRIPFVRKPNPDYKAKALLLDFDGTLRDTKSGAKFPTDPSDVIILPGRKEKLAAMQKAGYLLLGVSNQSGVAKGDLTIEQAKACFEKTQELLGFKIDVRFCPHKVPPITCYCRKPGVAMGVTFIEKYKLNPADCIVVGDMTSDKTFAARCGFQFSDAETFFQS